MFGLILSLTLASLCHSAVVDLTDVPAGPRVYYPSVCEIADCRYGNCEIYNSTFFRCHCFKSVTGVKCDELDKTGNPCTSSPCWGNSVCVNVAGQFSCVCEAGRVGPTCEAHSAPCKCQNNGACIFDSTTGGYTCNCPTNFGGNLCQYNLVNFNLCSAARPCQNFGFCTPQGTCVCPNGYAGKFCETIVSTVSPVTTTLTTTAANYCKTVVCQNGGVCIALSATQGFCNCATGFFGPSCEFFVPPTTTTTPAITTTAPTSAVLCPSSFVGVCKNNAICYIINNANIFCLCTAGFGGSVCEISLTTTTISTTTPTTTTTVTTTTTATTTTTTTTTTTPTTTTKPTTAITVGKCSFDICLNGGTCGTTATGALACACPPDYEGFRCETEIPFCKIPDVCKNGGLCLPLLDNDGVCFCQGSFSGLFCESVGCTPNPCQNDHDCFVSPTTGKAKCICRSGYSGDYCENVTPV